MLHWQLLHWLKGLSLATRVGIFSCLGHLFLLFAIFVVYKGNAVYNVMISSTMINTDAKIVYMPLHYSLKQASMKTSSGTRPSPIGFGGQANEGQKKSPAVQAKIDQGPSTTIVSQPTPRLRRPGPSTSEFTKKSQLTEKKKNKAAEKTKTKKTAAKIPEVKKVIEEKKCFDKLSTNGVDSEKSQAKEEHKPLEQKQIEETKSEQKPIDQVTPVATEIPPFVLSPSKHEATAPDQNIVYVGQAEMEALQLQEYIQNEMAAHWTPPAGIRSDAQCIVKIVVSHDGNNNQIILEQPSNILLFDSAARRAASQLQPPQWSYGKEILITFKP